MRARRPRTIESIQQLARPVQKKMPTLPALAMAASVAKPVPIVTPQVAPVVPPSDLTAALTTAELARRLPIDMDLPGADSLSFQEMAKRRAKWQRVRRIAVRTTAVGMVLLITMGGLLLSQSYLKLHKVFKGGTGTAAALKANVNPDLLKGEGSGRVNILLLGRGGGNHDGPDLTDSMMVASVDPVNHTATLLSLPRDLWVNVPNQGVMKINAAWEAGEFKYLGKIAPGSTDPKAIQAGFSMVDSTVESVLGINIDYNAIVDFQAFQQAVDTVGGVTVNVPTPLVDPTMAWQNGGNPVLAPAGLQTFDGATALNYVRSRETTSDFARAERQRDVLMALKSKIETLGVVSDPLKLSGLLNTFGNNVASDLSLSNVGRLYSIMKGVSGSKITSIDLDNDAGVTPGPSLVTTGNINGQSIVLPQAGLFQYGPIQQYVRGQLKDPYILKENARIFVLNGTTTPGLGSSMATELQSYGYNVVKVANTPTTGYTGNTLIDLNSKDKYTKNYLQERLGVTAQTSLSDKSIPTNGADFVIIIGSNEADPTQP